MLEKIDAFAKAFFGEGVDVRGVRVSYLHCVGAVGWWLLTMAAAAIVPKASLPSAPWHLIVLLPFQLLALGLLTLGVMRWSATKALWPAFALVLSAGATLGIACFFVILGWALYLGLLEKGELTPGLAPAGFPPWAVALFFVAVILGPWVFVLALGDFLERRFGATASRIGYGLAYFSVIGLLIGLWWIDWKGFAGTSEFFTGPGGANPAAFLTVLVPAIVVTKYFFEKSETGFWGIPFLLFSCVGWTQLIAWALGSLKYGSGSSLVQPPGMVWAKYFIVPFVFVLIQSLTDWIWNALKSIFQGEGSREGSEVVEGRMNGYPMLSWSQRVGTGRTTGAVLDAAERAIVLIVTGGCAAIGYWFGGWGGVVMGLIVGGVLAQGAHRRSVAPKLVNVGGYVPMLGEGGTRSATDQERRAESVVEVRSEDCTAYLERQGGDLFFCVACGDRSRGPLPVTDRVPFNSFQNFEEGSHRRWFRSQRGGDDLADWGVIIAQSSVGRVVRVAESVDQHAWLVELLVKLENTFIVPRPALLREASEAAAAERGETVAPLAPGEMPATPSRTF